MACSQRVRARSVVRCLVRMLRSCETWPTLLPTTTREGCPTTRLEALMRPAVAEVEGPTSICF